MSGRSRVRRAGLGAGLAAALGLTGLALLEAAPSQAANGVFLYKDSTSGLPVPVFSPPDEKCFDVFRASEAKNFTGTNVILFADGLCSEVMLTLKPGEAINLVFNSYGFSNGQASAPPGENR